MTLWLKGSAGLKSLPGAADEPERIPVSSD
jgi:hypothetical protein